MFQRENKMTQVKELALDMLKMVDLIVRENVGNSIVLSLYSKMVFPFLKRKILTTDDKLIKENLEISYKKLKPFFEKKQKKELLEEGEKLSGHKLHSTLRNMPEFKDVTEYF